MNLENIIIPEGIYVSLAPKGKDVLEIKRAQTFVKGGFKKFWKETLIPYCQENNINVITLTDSQTADRDVWGQDYGFSGFKARCGTRNVYLSLDPEDRTSINNTIIDMCLPHLDDLEFLEVIYAHLISTKKFENVTISKEKILEVCNERQLQGI